MTAAVVASAELSPCGRYRYRLARRWDPRAPQLGFVMLNPSTADATVDDPTIRRCMAFARRDGYGGVTVANLFAWRATRPADLVTVDDPFGPGNVEALEDLFAGHTTVVAAWGGKFAEVQRARNREAALGSPRWGVPDHPEMVRAMAARHDTALVCLGVTGDGSPRHPLYVPGDRALTPWPGLDV